MSLSGYDEYRSTALCWAPKIPAHWQLDRLKRSMVIVKNGIWGDEPQGDSSDIPCVRVADFDRVRLRAVLSDPTIRSVSESERNGRVLNRGDLLLEKSGGGETSPVGCVVLYDDPLPAVCSNFVARVIIRDDMYPSFWVYTHSVLYAARVNQRAIKQTSGIQNLDAGQYFDEVVPFPTLPEQRSIAAFLDRETAKIDALVAEQERLISLLREKRQAVISHAVTKGLNPDAPRKASGVEWLGEVPAHWKMQRLTEISTFIPGKAHEPFLDDDGPFVYVSSRFVSTGGVSRRFCLQNLTPACFGDSLLVMSDLPNGRALAKCFFVADDLPYAVNQRVCILRPLDVVPKYLAYLVDRNPEFLQHNDGMNQTHLSNGDILKPRFPMPPKDEQLRAVEFLDAQLSTIDELVEHANALTQVILERRFALISAAVTGQIDVRHLTAADAA